jgi:tRNA-intron endonuclease
MQIIGELVDNYILIAKSRDIGRLYNKSRFGETIKGDRLRLNLLEGVFLLDENKITVFQNKKKICFQKLFTLAAENISRFEINYLIFRDLRKRGHAVSLCKDLKNIDFVISNKGVVPCFIVSFSERDVVTIDKIKNLITSAEENNSNLWFAIVDDEGDITYYDVKTITLAGHTAKNVFEKGDGFVFEDRVVIFDKKISEKLHKSEFFGKPLAEGLQLSPIESLYLAENGILILKLADSGKKLSPRVFTDFIKKHQTDIELKLLVFKDLKKNGLLVKTGFKFGAHFRVYTNQPDKTHAEYLVHVVDKGFTSSWADISRAIRLAHSVNKEIVFAKTDGKKIDYIQLGRLRP